MSGHMFKLKIHLLFGREVTFKSPDKEVSPGKWSMIFENQSATDWGVGCDIITVIFTINDSTYTVLSDGKMYCYSHNANTLTYLSETIFTYPEIHFSVVYNGYAYVFSKNVFYKFDPKTLTFTMLSDFGQNLINSGASGFLSGDNIYVGIGPSKEYWKYNITTDTWHQVKPFPGENSSGSYAISLDKTGYIGISNNSQTWYYDTENDLWTQRADSPFAAGYPYTCTNTMTYGYCFFYKYLYKYYPVFDYWEKLAEINYSEGFLCYPRIFAIGDKIFLINVWNMDNTDHYNVWAYEE